jgi:hypothetical protein
MAMYLQQKDVEEAVLAWIQAACMFMIDEVDEKTADSFADRRKVLAVLKEQETEWEAVCSPPCTTYFPLSLFFCWPLPGPQGRGIENCVTVLILCTA